MIGKGIPISTGFDLNSQSPLDNRTIFKTIEERDALPNINLYEGLRCFIEDTKENYQYIDGAWCIEEIWDDVIVTKDEINNRNVISFYSKGVLQKTIYIDRLGGGTNIKEVQYGNTAPTDENVLLWVDTTSDNGASSLLSDALILEFRNAITNLNSQITNLNSQIVDLKARVLYLEQNGGGGGTVIVGSSYINLEDGTQLMLEDGTMLLLESSENEEFIDVLITLEDGTILTFEDGTQMSF